MMKVKKKNKAFRLFLELLEVQTGYLRERSKLLMSEIIDIYIAVKTIFGPFICKFMCSKRLWILVHATRRVFPVSLDGLYSPPYLPFYSAYSYDHFCPMIFINPSDFCDYYSISEALLSASLLLNGFLFT